MGTKRRNTILVGALCALLISLAFAGSASSKVVNLRVNDGTVTDGTGSVGAPAPFQGTVQMDISLANGDFIVGSGGYWYKFNSAGNPLAFSAISPTTVVGTTGQSGWSDVAMDNSGGAGGVGEGEQGRIYGMQEGGATTAWKANGEPAPGPFGTGVSVGGVCAMDVAPDGNVWIASYQSQEVIEFNPDGTATGTQFNSGLSNCGMEIDGAGNFYLTAWPSDGTHKFSPAGAKLGPLEVDGEEAKDVAVDSSDGHVYVLHESFINEYDAAGAFVLKFGQAEGPFEGLQGAQGIAADEGVVYAATNGGPQARVVSFVRTGDITIPDVTTGSASVTPSTANLTGEIDPDVANGGTPIDTCNFEWGSDPSNLENDAPCDGSAPFDGAVEATVSSGLSLGTTYYYKLTAANEGNGVISSGAIKTFEPAGPPEITNEAVSEVNTDGATISATINPGGGFTKYRINYGETTAYGNTIPEPDAEVVDNLLPEDVSYALSGLKPGTTYHYQVSADNPNGPTVGPDHEFTTFPNNPGGPDPCANAQVRQQTGAALLLDCRAYELVSAPDTDGYDVTSNIVPGLVTLPAQPRANDRVLYSLQFGVVPGAGDPTNFGQDPYVATRGSGSWSTGYVGIPASGTPSNVPFGSPLAGSSRGLSAFAFGNGALCDPCFSDGSTGIPVRMANGALVQGMKGSLEPAGAEPAGYIGQPLSDDGSHLVFGSTSKLEPAGNTGSLTIYDRNLNAATTQVVSTLPNGSTMTGAVAGLDVSADGSRVLVGKAVSTDAKGNTYYDLYMHVGANPNSVQVADTPSGVIFNGMTDDGSQVLFTTPDAVPGSGDTDTSADVFRADVSSSAASIARVSTGTGGAGNSDACNPVPGKEGPDWNVLSGGPTNCGVLGLAGGAGVASQDGTVFFLSPEKLDGAGTLNAANVFVARPGGAPQYVATVEPDLSMATNALNDSEVHRYQDFQVTQDGGFAVFSSTLSLTGFDTFDRSQIFRYDTAADSLVCASCAGTGAAPTGNTALSSGLNVADDGSVFFTSVEALVLRDTNGKQDAYEWKSGKQELISTGTSNFDSGLLGVSADGVNAYFFTRATLSPQDNNGETMKIYDARAGGGFLSVPPLPLCAAKDECHGPGTAVAPPPQIGTFKGKGGNAKSKKCKKGYVKKNGKCKKKKPNKNKKGGGR